MQDLPSSGRRQPHPVPIVDLFLQLCDHQGFGGGVAALAQRGEGRPGICHPECEPQGYSFTEQFASLSCAEHAVSAASGCWELTRTKAVFCPSVFCLKGHFQISAHAQFPCNRGKSGSFPVTPKPLHLCRLPLSAILDGGSL
jgi:hypothetical protein